MILKSISLQNFRSYTKPEFAFGSNTSIIVGPNTSGKTNLIEAISLLSTGKSFRAEKDVQMIRFEKEMARVKGKVEDPEDPSRSPSGSVRTRLTERIDGAGIALEVLLTIGEVGGRKAPLKRYMVNGVGKRLVDFAAHLPTVLFSPSDLAIIADSPSGRRKFLDAVLEQANREYRLAHSEYVKALRQRNALLEQVRETGKRDNRVFAYWDELLIKNATIISLEREAFIKAFNDSTKEIFDCTAMYDKSILSEERLLQYKDAEVGAGVTLVGPHRDDFCVRIYPNGNTPNKHELVDLKFYGSRGQQRLAILQLKVFQLSFLEKTLEKRPLLLLDDIFSELDSGHIELVSGLIGKQQTIMTTTHEEFVDKKVIGEASVVELKTP